VLLGQVCFEVVSRPSHQGVLLGSSLYDTGFGPTWTMGYAQLRDACEQIAPPDRQPAPWSMSQVLLKGTDQLQGRLEA
jgi:hypothetical protein